VREVLERLRDAGHPSWLAGGCVRDLLCGRTPDDWDVATPALPEQVLALFPRTVPTGLQHGTVTVLTDTPPGKVEATTFRGEGEYLDGRRPSSVEFIADVDRDLARRDFTVNAIAWDPLSGRVCDPFGGVADLVRRRIRAVGDPAARFAEDGLRPLRAVRFSSVLGFGLDGTTAAAIPATLGTFRRVAAERVREEFTKLLVRSPRPSRGLELLERTGLLGDIVPELREGIGFTQNRWHRWTVWEHVKRVVDGVPARTEVRLAALLHDVAKPRCAEQTTPGEHTFYRHEFVGADLAAAILERLRQPRRTVDAVAHLVREHNWTYGSEWNDGTVRRHLAQLGTDALEDFFALREADIRARGRAVGSGLRNIAELRERFDAELRKASALSVRDLAVRGPDVMQTLGVGPGPAVGKALAALLQHVLDHPEDNARERLLDILRTEHGKAASGGS